MYFVTQAALKRHKQAKVCRTMNVECWLHGDEDGDLPEEEPEVVQVVEATASRQQPVRNIFDLFNEQFVECETESNKS